MKTFWSPSRFCQEIAATPASRLLSVVVCALLLCAPRAEAECERELQTLKVREPVHAANDTLTTFDADLNAITTTSDGWYSYPGIGPRPSDQAEALRRLAAHWDKFLPARNGSLGWQNVYLPIKSCRARYLADQIDAQRRPAPPAPPNRAAAPAAPTLQVPQVVSPAATSSVARTPGPAAARSDAPVGRTTGASAGAAIVSGRPTVDSGTKPGSGERRDLCTQYFQAVNRPASLEQEWIADCLAMGALAIRNITVLPPEKSWFNGDVCLTVSARKTEPWGRQLKTYVQVLNGCPGPQLFYVELKTAQGIWSPPMWAWPAPLLEKRLWPVNNALPKLGYVSMLERDTAMPIRKGEVWTAEVLQSATEAEDIAVKVLACDYATPQGRPRTVFRNAAFTAADCFDIPPAERSANEKEWERLQRDPRPIGPKRKAKTPQPAPGAKP